MQLERPGSSWYEAAKVLALCTFYLGTNFLPIWLPLLGYLAYNGSWTCRGLWALVLVDYLVPLRMPGLFWPWCNLTNDYRGKMSYFNGKVIAEGEFRKDQNYLLCYHPHSLFGIGYNMMTRHLLDKYGIWTLFTGADVVQYLPLLRRILVWWGFTPVDAKAMKKNMKLPYPHNALTLLVGGISEMFYGLEEEQIILRRRKGFCKLALETGACLVPVYVFGANQTYHRLTGHKSFLAHLSSKIRMSLIVWVDRFGIPFGVIPCKTRMVVAMGKPMEVTQVLNPTQDQIDQLHNRYIEELRGLFDRHKAEMGPEWEKKRLWLEDEDPRSKKD